MTNKANSPVIDWAQHSQSGVSEPSPMSKELLALFLQQLPELQSSVEQAFAAADIEAILSSLHRFQGACAYCGLPRLRAALSEANAAVRETKTVKQEHLTSIQNEIATVRDELKKFAI